MIDWTGWNLFRWGQSFTLLPKSVGVYAFVDEHGKVLYVGASTNIWNRVRKHEITQQTVMNGVLVYWLGCSRLELEGQEKRAIETLRPSMNLIPGQQKSSLAHYSSGGTISFATTPEDAALVAKLLLHVTMRLGVPVKNSQLLRLAVRALADKEGVV